MRSNVGALAVLLGVTVAARRCERDPHDVPHVDAAWDGRGIVATWRAGRSVYVERERSVRVLRQRTAGGEPAISATPSGFLVAATDDSPRERDWRDAVTIPVDHDGRAAGPRVAHPTVVSADRQCRTSSDIDPRVASGTLHDRRDGGAYYLDLDLDDERGEHLSNAMWIMLAYPIECTLASHGDDLASAVRFSGNLSIDILDKRALNDDHVSFAIEGIAGGAEPWRLAMIATGDGQWAALYRATNGGLRVARFDRAGVIETIALPLDVDAATADLGVTDRGLFVSWLDGATLHVRGARGGPNRTAHASRGAGLRAVGHDDVCAVVVRDRDDDIEVRRFASCP